MQAPTDPLYQPSPSDKQVKTEKTTVITEQKFMEKLFEHPTEKDSSGKPLKLSYAESRMLYG